MAKTKSKQKLIDDKVGRARKIKTASKPTNINIMAIDQATKCGIAWELVGENYRCDMWDLSIKSKESQGMKWIRFESRLKEFIIKNGINVVAYELPSGRNINPIIHSSKLICIIEKLSTELGVEYIEFSAAEIKKFATSSGNAGKPLMIEFAERLWGYKGSDDNEADAIHILHLLKSKING
jgi:Holliday junction resolvasome RuvABC endonuclease subunit